MSLRDQIEAQLQQLHAAGAGMPTTAQASDAAGRVLRIELTSVDSLSCAFSELSLFVPSLQQAAFDALKQWAQALSQKITYLLENIGPLEFDPAAGEVLIRSTPPQQLSSGAQFYEIILSSAGSGTFLLRRYRSVAGQPGRTAVDIQVTREVLSRLIDDLLSTIPATP